MTPAITLSEIIRKFKIELGDLYPENEIRNIGFLITEHLLNYSKIDFHLKEKESISAETAKKFDAALERLKNWEPVQYVTGYTEFYGLPFRVDKRVLIPRPETEELAEWIIRENKFLAGALLDIGTGSGCLAVTLAVNLPRFAVWASDISESALAVAGMNADANQARVSFLNMDILNVDSVMQQKVQVIVSNPPYVRHSEKKRMRRNVLDYEPATALFVPDDNPLLFYRNIALFGRRFLDEGGKLYLEINEAFPDEVVKILQGSGFYGIQVRNDMTGRARMVRAFK